MNRNDFKILLSLASPLILTGVLESSIGFISSIFLAKLDYKNLGAGSLVIWFFTALVIIMWGVIVAISVLVSRYNGAKDDKSVALVLRDGLWLVILLIIPASILIWDMSPILYYFGQKPSIIAVAVPYMHALAWSILPDFIGLALLQFIIGLGHTRTNLIFTICWVPLNIAFNYIFVYGKLGFPKLTIAGLGWGTTVSYWITTLGLIIYMAYRPCYRRYWWALWTFTTPTFLKELIKVGLPMGLMWFVEIAFFFALALIMGHIGINQLAANQVTMQFVSFFAAVIFSTAQAITIRVGNQIGAKQFSTANRATYAGIIIAFCFTILFAIVSWFFPDWIIALDFNKRHTHNPEMLYNAKIFLAIAAVFLLFESTRITLFGALRALKDTIFTLLISFIAFWCIAIPLGYFLAENLNLGAKAYWLGLAFSAIVNCAILYGRYRKKMRIMMI